MSSDNRFLATEPVGKLLWKLAIPTVAAQLINMLYNIVDRVYIGHMPGDGSLALTGVGICLPVIMIVTAFASLIGAGGAPQASIFMGRQEPDTAEKILGSCLTLQMIVSVLLTAVLLTGNRSFLLVFGASENTIGYAVDYMNLYALGTFFVQLTLGMNAYITAQGFAKTSMLTVLIGAICNIILDPIFIFALGMGVKGAALATVISQGVSCTWVMAFLCGKKTLLKVKHKNLRLNAKILLPCLALGLSPFIMQASESVIFVCFNSSLLRYGGDIAVGAMTILTSVMQFALLPLQGLGQGAQPITSYNFGAGNAQRVKDTFLLLLKVSMLFSVAFWVLVMLFPRVFASLFTPDPELLAFASKVLRIYCGALCLFGIQVSCQLTFVAIGYAKSSIVVAVVRKFVLLLPLIYLMPMLMANQTLAVYIAEPVADVIAVTFTAILFSLRFRQAIRSIDNSKPTPSYRTIKEDPTLRLMIASDIHGDAACCQALLDAFQREKPDRLLLLGDLLYHGPRNPLPQDYDPQQVIRLLNEQKNHLLCVRGNCDCEVDQMVLDFPILAEYCLLYHKNRVLYVTHGHHACRQDPPPLGPRDILLHGHTHVPAWEDFGQGNLYLNPGSVSIPKENSPRGYLLLTDQEALWKDLAGQVYHRLAL